MPARPLDDSRISPPPARPVEQDGYVAAADEKKTADRTEGEFASLGQNERKIYRLALPERTVEKLIDLSRLGEFETCKALLNLVNLSFLKPIPRSRYEFILALYKRHELIKQSDPATAARTNVRWAGVRWAGVRWTGVRRTGVAGRAARGARRATRRGPGGSIRLDDRDGSGQGIQRDGVAGARAGGLVE